MYVKPERLLPGDTVGVIAPASPTSLDALENGIQFLKELGLDVKLGKNINNSFGYLAGTDQERLADLHQMFADPDVKAIICARGGYGTARFAGQLDYELIKKNPKIFLGYSDITFLHTAISNETGLVTFHGPMPASDFSKEGAHPLSKESYFFLFEPEKLCYTEEFTPLEPIVEGMASGPIVGGNLTLIVSSLGTPYEINTQEKLLLIEEINEEPRAIDRMMNQLLMAGKLTDSAGIIIGDFNGCERRSENSLSLSEVMNHYLRLAGKPAMKGFQFGHCNPNIMVPLGVPATLNTFSKSLIVESGIK